MAANLCDDEYIWSLCSAATLARISQTCGEEGELPATLWQQAHTAHAQDDLDGTIVLGALALKSLTDDGIKAKFRDYGYNWCFLLEKKWLLIREDAVKDCLKAAWTKFLQLSSSYHADWYRSLDTENLQSRHGYQKSRSEKDWDKCYLIGTIVVSATENRCDEAYATSQLGALTYARGYNASDHSVRKAMFELCLRYQEKAVSVFKEDEPVNYGVYYGYIAHSHAMLWEIEQTEFRERFQHCNDAIEVFGKTLSLLGSENKAWLGCSDRLARLYWARWKETYKDQDADSGLRVFESILQLHPNNPYARSGLSELYNQRANNIVMANAQRRNETDKSLELLENLIVDTSDQDEALPSRLGKCSGVLAERFAYDGSVQDIDIAIELQKTAIGLQQTNQASVWFHHAQLSHYWQRRYYHTRIPNDLQIAEEAARDSIRTAGRVASSRARGLEELACIQSISYQRGNRQNDTSVINDAISNFREAMSLRPDWRSVVLLRNLGEALLLRFDCGGGYQEAAEGIVYLREAVDILRRQSGKGSNQQEIFALSALARALMKRYHRFSGKDDLDESIRPARFTLTLMDEEHVQSTDLVADLCFALGLRYELDRKDVDIDEAQQRAETAISYLSERASPSERFRLGNTLGQIFLRKYRVTEAPRSILKAVEHFQNCLKPTSSPLDSFAVEVKLSAKENLAQAFRIRAVTNKSLDYYSEALKFYLRLLAECNSDPSQRHLHLTILDCTAEVALAVWKLAWGNGKGPTSQLPETRNYGLVARRAFRQLLEHGKGQPSMIINAAAELAQLHYLLDKDLHNASRYSSLALNLLDATMLGLNRLDCLRLAKRFSYLTSMNLCYSVLGNKTIEKALQDFEAARTLIWNRQMDDKSPVNSLKECHMELATQFEQLRMQLAGSREPISRLDTDRMKYTAPDYYQIALEYNEILKRIRSQKGFADFLLTPSSVQDLQNLACDGSIAVVNVTPWYSHAILIRHDSIANIELPIRDHDGKECHEGFEVALKQVTHDLPAATNVLGQVMQWLWDGIAKPILDALGFKKTTDGSTLPRMWWLTTGWLNVLPIHTAANFSDTPGANIVDSVMDRVVSSYVPNLRALKFARGRHTTLWNNEQAEKMLLVQMLETPGYDTLPNSRKEIAEVARIVGGSFSCIQRENPTRKIVMADMEQVSLMHFVCHGVADADDPTKSRLLLADHVISPFDVRACHKANLDKCQLAYLSACETAMTRNPALKDEGIHIADAVLMAGVPNVIATWWRVVDEESVSMAVGFYENLVDDDGLFSTARSARAVHAAAKILRDKGTNPFIWGAYVHFGA